MKVLKRSGEKTEFDASKIEARIRKLQEGLGFLEEIKTEVVDPHFLTEKTSERIYEDIPTTKIDELVAQICASMVTKHPDFGVVASRVAINNLHKETPANFSEAMEKLYHHFDSNGQVGSILNDQTIELVRRHSHALDEMIRHERDYDLDYFGYMTLAKAYLLRVANRLVERPQYMWLRVSLAIHGDDLESVQRSYDYMSKRYFTHATPTLFHAGTRYQQLSSCFLLGTEDSVDAIYKSVSDIAMISKWAGGIGIHLTNVRARGSYIRSTGRISDGIIPLLKVLNSTARYINQSGRRNGSIAVYLEPWHSDIQAFLEAKKNRGNEEERARDLFYALWIPDLFMERVEKDEHWSLMCPDECPGLTKVHSKDFNQLYLKYEKQGRYKRQVPAREVFNWIVDSQIETGTPYMLYKDSCNRKTNQSNLGVIRSSNLCAEIVEYSDSREYAVCNLASIALHQFVKESTQTYDFDGLEKVVKVVVENLDKVIDINSYPVDETERSNMRHRPIGIGVQGLADTYIKMRLPFESKQARRLNREIFETIYYAAVSRSCDLAEEKGAYESFEGCPLSRGKFQFDLWEEEASERYDWDALRERVRKVGLRNSQLVALMPTASTSQILGSNECIEPFTSNIYVRRTLAGEFAIINKYLIRDLVERGLWTDRLRDEIFRQRGSIQNIEEIPESIREIYKTAWEIRQREILDQAIGRGPFVCQSQSLNIFVKNPTFNLLYSIHMYGWNRGLKTGSYYIRTAPAADMQQFTLDPTKANATQALPSSPEKEGRKATGAVGPETSNEHPTRNPSAVDTTKKVWACKMEDGCEMCGS